MDWVVQPNTAATRRTGTITVSYRSNPAYSYFPAPDIVTVSQNGLPSYTFTPATITLTSVAQSVGTPMLIDNSQVSQADFVFRSTDSWITVPRGPQRPFGDWIAPPVVSPLTVPFSVSVNTGPDRTGTITVYDSNETSPANIGSWPAAATLTVIQKSASTTVPPTTPPGTGGSGSATTWSKPFNLPEQWGYYVRCATGNDGGIYTWRTNNNAPFTTAGFDVGPVWVTAGGTYDNSRIAYDTETRRLYIVYKRVNSTTMPQSADIYLGRSDDDAATWGGADLVIPGGTKPTIAAAIDRTLVIAAYVGPVGGPGVIQAVVKAPGDVTFSTPYTLKDNTGSALVAQDDTFHLIMPPAGDRSWQIAFMRGSDTQPSLWTSADADCSSLKLVSLLIPGGTHPTVTHGIDGTVVAAAYVGPVGGTGIIQAVMRGPGDAAFSAVYTFKDSTGTALVAQDSTFHLVMPPSGEQIWVLVVMIGANTAPGEMHSADPDASTWKTY